MKLVIPSPVSLIENLSCLFRALRFRYSSLLTFVDLIQYRVRLYSPLLTEISFDFRQLNVVYLIIDNQRNGLETPLIVYDLIHELQFRQLLRFLSKYPSLRKVQVFVRRVLSQL